MESCVAKLQSSSTPALGRTSITVARETGYILRAAAGGLQQQRAGKGRGSRHQASPARSGERRSRWSEGASLRLSYLSLSPHTHTKDTHPHHSASEETENPFTHPLTMPVATAFVSPPLGYSIPYLTPHAVSVSLPKWEDNVDYEEGRKRVVDAMQTGYPRFFVHRSIQAVGVRGSAFLSLMTVSRVLCAP